MNITKALSIDGWMAENELECLANLASNSKQIAEIGSWMGRSTAALAANTTGSVHAIDTWAGSAETVHYLQLAGKTPQWLLETFKQNTSEFNNIVTHQMTSIEGAKYFSEGNHIFDLIFIDAAHDYTSVKNDILAWKPLLSKNGIICGHDYTSGWPGTVQAVNELITKFHVVGTIWISEV